jgi:phytoene/squalene synthetase
MHSSPTIIRPLQVTKEKQPDRLAAAITKAASRQSYYIVRFLVDRDRVAEAYRAYAYFRWMDDRLDLEFSNRSERIAFVHRQRSLMDRGYRGDWPLDCTAEETMLAGLICEDKLDHGSLQSYIRNMMAVMDFDARRRDRLISQAELTTYTRWLSTAVTDALHHFIGNKCFSPQIENRHLAATGAHIAHMLRDTLDDLQAGYFNIPREVLEKHRITPWDVQSEPYRMWVKERVDLARSCFKAGQEYLSKVENLRCRIAGHTYIGRFEPVLDAIERDQYVLRSDYSECKSLKTGWRICLSALSQSRHYRQVRTSLPAPMVEEG